LKTSPFCDALTSSGRLFHFSTARTDTKRLASLVKETGGD
jgi:hypothetical protein